MKKLLSLSLILSLGLATVTPALNAAQSKQAVAQSQANPAHASGWQAAKKWWRSGRNMKALNPQEQRAFRALRTKFTIGAIIAMLAGGAALAIGYKKEQAGQRERAWAAAVAAVAADQAAARDARLAAFYAGRPAAAAAPRATEPVVTPAIAARLGQELIDAAVRGDDNKVKELLKVKGIDVNATDLLYGFTPLMMAAGGGHAAIVKLLLDAGANNVNFANFSEGATALMMAVEGGHKDTVELLLKAGASRTMKNEHKQTAEDIARAKGYEELTNMIREYVPRE